MKGPAYRSPTRDILVLSAVTVAFVLLTARASVLQISSNETLQAEGDARFVREQTVIANRGIIRDRNGVILAISTPVDSVWAEPNILKQHSQQWNDLATELEISVEWLEAEINKYAKPGREFMYLKRHLPPQHAQRVIDLEIPGVFLRREYRRYYPQGPSSANLIGFTDVDDIGLEGVERSMNNRLQGHNGLRRVIKDRLGNVVEHLETLRHVKDGEDVRLSIDARIQQVVHKQLIKTVTEHKAKGAVAVVVDSLTGEILAIASIPSFNPNVTNQRNSTRNVAVTDVFEPGSTVKPLVIAKALMDGIVRPDTMVDTSPGQVWVGGFKIRDVRNYGELSVQDVLMKSSNIGMMKIGSQIPPEVLADFYRQLGFSRSTGSGILGENSGLFPNRSRWYESEHAALTYGYGFAATVLQIAQAYSAIANGGELQPLTITPNGKQHPSSLVMPQSIAIEVTKMMERVVTPTGTAKNAKIPLYRVAGKTATTKKLIEKQYANKYLSMFTGFAPASNPRLITTVLVDEPGSGEYYGGVVAAPAFREIMTVALRLLNVPPDDLGQIAKLDDSTTSGTNAEL